MLRTISLFSSWKNVFLSLIWAIWRSQVEAVFVFTFLCSKRFWHICQKFNLKEFLSPLFQERPTHSLWRKWKHTAPRCPQCEMEAVLHACIICYLKMENTHSALWLHICHFESCLGCCSLRVTLPQRSRLDLCLGGNVPSQTRMTTAWGRLHSHPLELRTETACWLSSDKIEMTSTVYFLSLCIL